jgi:hypothetical protein
MPPQADGLGALLAAAVDAEAGEDLSALGGAPLLVLPTQDAAQAAAIADRLRPGAPILVGVDLAGRTPDGCEAAFDILLTTAAHPPRPWVGVGAEGVDSPIATLRAAAAASPAAAAIFATVLRLGDQLDFEAALAVESLAYSALLGGKAFRAWRTARPARTRDGEGGPFVRLDRDGALATVTLTRPAARNAIGARVRDELTDALRLIALDPSIERAQLRGEGPIFSAGGDLDEFGKAGDLAMAHIIRTQRSPARLARELGSRLTVFIQGAAIGGGIEIAAGAAAIVADPAAVFRLPEVGMGLIPGAGGTATIPRRIGRHRACYMGLAGQDIAAALALDWGLVDRLGPVE